MKFLLDTNICIRYLSGRSIQVRAKLPTVPAQEIAVCSVVKAELYFGAAKSNVSEKTLAGQREFLNQFHSLPFTMRRRLNMHKFVLNSKNVVRPLVQMT